MTTNKRHWEPDEPSLPGKVAGLLQVLDQEVPRDPAAAALGKQRFLEIARSLTEDRNVPSASDYPIKAPTFDKPGFREWISSLFQKKGAFHMSTIVTILVIVLIVLGGTGITVYAAQGSNPGQMLYSVKLASEDVQIELQNNQQTRLHLALQFADERIVEMHGILRAGGNLPQGVVERWQYQLDLALQQAAGMDDTQITRALQQIREHLRTETQLMNGAQGEQSQNVQARIQAMIRERLQLVEDGLVEPQEFRLRVRSGKLDQEPGDNPKDNGNPMTGEKPTPGAYGPGPGNGECDGCTHDGEDSQNPFTEDTPTQGSGYGPGPGDGECAGIIQQDCGPGGESQNPSIDVTPTPGSGYGPGPGDGTCDNCQPGSKDGNGPGSNQPGGGGGSGGGTMDGGGSGGSTEGGGSDGGGGAAGGGGTTGGGGSSGGGGGKP